MATPHGGAGAEQQEELLPQQHHHHHEVVEEEQQLQPDAQQEVESSLVLSTAESLVLAATVGDLPYLQQHLDTLEQEQEGEALEGRNPNATPSLHPFPRPSSRPPPNLSSLLAAAAAHGHEACVTYLLRRGASVEHTDEGGTSLRLLHPFFRPSLQNSPSVSSVSPSLPPPSLPPSLPPSFPPLPFVIHGSSSDFLNRLPPSLSHSSSHPPSLPPPPLGCTPLYDACKAGHEGVVRLLIQVREGERKSGDRKGGRKEGRKEGREREREERSNCLRKRRVEERWRHTKARAAL